MLRWGGLVFSSWNSTGVIVTTAGVAVVVLIGAVELQARVPASAVCGGAVAGAVMSYIVDCGNRFFSLPGSDKLRFVSLMSVGYVLGAVMGWIGFGS